ncbi:zinc ribbon domain-containing protein [Ruminococcus sp. NK3A76]|uniref:zinc ribbon domain-containing protein n=1 Tax=Ruminococcus sp. NK3A76 TaxID=877411 RepID=UPI00048ABC59|nr:zinc ribbon domain-containing protein [Ruminococcus sp. NK3A76]
METKDMILQLRTKHGLSQDELAQKVFVTRQAVSRWENGDTVPNTDTLRLLSEVFGVSINAILGEPSQLICQCCGMPLEEDIISIGKDGKPDTDYCKWCYADGEYMYSDMDDLIDVCVKNWPGNDLTDEQKRSHLKGFLPTLGYWKNHSELANDGAFEDFKRRLVDEINALGIPGMPKVDKLNALVGSYVDLAYPLPSGAAVSFLDKSATYLGNQLESADGRCFGVLANAEFILISTYGEKCKDPELLLYKKR